jgi:hypothetical protein
MLSFEEKANTSSSDVGDMVSLSAESLSVDIDSDSASTTVELSSQSVSLTVSLMLENYDLTSITPNDLDCLSAELYNNGIISKEQFLTLGSIAFYHKYGNEHVLNPDDSPFNLLSDLRDIASGNHECLSCSTWDRDTNYQNDLASSLLDILKDLHDTTIEVSAESVSAELTIEKALGDYDLTSITPGDARRFASTLWKSGIISTDEFQTILVIATKNQFPYAPGVEGPANDNPFNLLEQINQVANGTHEQLSADNHQWLAFDGRETSVSLLDILTELEYDTSATVEMDHLSLNFKITA